MSYPTEQEVKDASREQLCAWWRFLPSPGMAAIGQPDFNEVMLAEAKIIHYAKTVKCSGKSTNNAKTAEAQELALKASRARNIRRPVSIAKDQDSPRLKKLD